MIAYVHLLYDQYKYSVLIVSISVVSLVVCVQVVFLINEQEYKVLQKHQCLALKIIEYCCEYKFTLRGTSSGKCTQVCVPISIQVHTLHSLNITL